MNDPGIAIQTAMVTAIVAKLTANGYTSPAQRVVIDPEEGVTPLPHVVMGVDTVVPFATKTSEGGEVTHTVVCWARKFSSAATLRNEVIQCLTDRDAMLSVTGYTTVRADLDFRGPVLQPVAPGEDEGVLYGFPVRFRFVVVQD